MNGSAGSSLQTANANALLKVMRHQETSSLVPALQVGLERGHATHLNTDVEQHVRLSALIESLPVGLVHVLDPSCGETTGLTIF